MSTQSRSKFLATLDGHVTSTPPVWLMRQAGRYLPEYREIRAKAPSFLDFCYDPQLASEATVQPIERFGFDAAILFSDILVVPDALGQHVRFETGEGPRLTPISNAADLKALRENSDQGKMSRVYEAVERVRARLPQEVMATLQAAGVPVHCSAASRDCFDHAEALLQQVNAVPGATTVITQTLSNVNYAATSGSGNASIGAIQRGLLALEQQDADQFFGEPADRKSVV